MKRENLLKWIRRHPVLFVANLLFLAWFVFLLVFHLQSARYVRFYDVLAQEDVSDQYFSELPIIRYFFEPLSGTIFSLGQDFDWLIGFVIVYALFRLFYLILKRVKKNRVYSNPVLLLLRDGLYFTLRYSFSLLLGILGYLGILFWQKGFFPVANQYSL